MENIINKTCSVCNKTKERNCFSTNGKKGLRSECKECRNMKAKQHRIDNLDKYREKDKKYYDKNKEIILEKSKQYNILNHDKICQNKKKYYQENIESIKDYHQKNKELRNQKKKERNKNDTLFRIKESLKTRIHKVLNCNKTDKSWNYIDCTCNELKEWLEYQFDNNMTWDNYSIYWHIDHVIPIATFNLLNKVQQKRCFHWTNLRPLNKSENMSKSDKIIIEDILKHRTVLQNYISINERYQAMFERTLWLRLELRYGKNPEDELVKLFTDEMGNPQPRS